MKNFINKVKSANKIFLSMIIITAILYMFFYIPFIFNVLKLNGIEDILRYLALILFGIWFIFYLIYGIYKLFSKKYSSIVILEIFTLLFTAIFFFGSYYIKGIYDELDGMNKDVVVYQTDLITLNEREFNSESKIGIINDPENIDNNVLAKKMIEKEGITNQIYQYDDFYLMLEDLYSGVIDACFLSDNYGVIFGGEEPYSNIENETKILKTYSEEMKNADNVSFTNKKLTEPFTILVMGVDSEIDGLKANAAFNGDTLMLVTFNPKTLTASMFSLPRDIFVPIACRNNALAKINSSAAYGSSCVIQTIKNLTSIDIDYYVKINFQGVVDLVDTLGGVEVNVEEPWSWYNAGVNYNGQVCEQNSKREFGGKVVCMDPGLQILNGEQALAYSRNRHQYLGSDLDRIRHQQDVVQAIAAKAKNIRSFDEFKNVLNAVQRNIDTNMTTDQILSLYNVGKSVLLNAMSGNDFNLSIKRTTLETYSAPIFLGSSTTSALGYYKTSLDDIVKMMKVNLELEDEKVNKTFCIDYNEEYESNYYGKGFRAEKSIETMPSLIGKSKQEVETWANNLGVNLSMVDVYNGDEHYNYLYAPNIVVDQSIHVNSVISTGSNLTVYVNQKSISYHEEEEEENNNNNNENNNIESIPGAPQQSEENSGPSENEEVIENEE